MRIRAAGAAAGHRIHRPPRLPGRLHRRMLPRDMGAVALPPGHAAARGRPAGGHRLRPGRHGGRRRQASARQALPGVPDGGLLGLAAEARAGRALLAAGAGMRGWVQSLPQDRGLDAPGLPAAQPLADPVGLLQAAHILRLQPGRRARGAAGRGLLPVEQCSRHPVLPVRLVQGRGARAGAARLAQHHPPQRHRPRRAHRHLLVWLLCFPQCPPCRVRVPLPHVKDQSTMGLLLVKVVEWPKRAAVLEHLHQITHPSPPILKKTIFLVMRGAPTYYQFDPHYQFFLMISKTHLPLAQMKGIHPSILFTIRGVLVICCNTSYKKIYKGRDKMYR